MAETLTAYQAKDEEDHELPDGQQVHVWPGSYVIARGATVVEICNELRFRQLYESVELRTLLLNDGERSVIEGYLGLGSTETPKHLVVAISRLARLRIGAIEVPWTPGQWEELAHRAEKRGITVETLARQIVDRITSEIWEGRA